MTACNQYFPQGSRWLRADFHLHTAADRTFAYTGDAAHYHIDYIEALKSAGIEVGLIANHNRFDAKEFRILQKIAAKQGIFLIPGIELSVNDGSNGIHTLVAFSSSWLENGDLINQFLSVAFIGRAPEQYENDHGRCSLSLLETINKLEAFNKDFFLVFAHVEDKSGLWHELDGGRIGELASSEHFLELTIAFQKVRTHDKPDCKCRTKVKQWLGFAYPAEVEGSDPKSIDQIGKGKSCYVKIGDFTFDAVKYALIDHPHRVSSQPDPYKHAYIESVHFTGGVLDGETIHFAPELNTLIGVRGSGKSSVLEMIRYALDIPFGENALDVDYKNGLVGFALGSGGKITLRVVNRQGLKFDIRRIFQQSADVYVEERLQPGISIRETVLHKPIYFGQKDLTATGEGFEKDLVEKLVGDSLAGIRVRIADQKQIVIDTIRQIRQLENIEDQKEIYTRDMQDAKFKLDLYKKFGVEEKLQKQVDYDKDERKCDQVIAFTRQYLQAFESFINQYEDDLKNQTVYSSKSNDLFFDAMFAVYAQLVDDFTKIKALYANGHIVLNSLQQRTDAFRQQKDGLKESFAKIERDLAEQLKKSGAQAIRPDEFRQLNKTLEHAVYMIAKLEKEASIRASLQQKLWSEMAALNDLWHQEYTVIGDELSKVNEHHTSLKISAAYKGDRDAVIRYMKDIFRGSHIRETSFQDIVDRYSDFGDMYKNLDDITNRMGNLASSFRQYFINNLESLIPYQAPNRFTIEYRGKELKHHSLGQRASALILFVLSQQDSDVYLIDQPEDDLDNQTIYEDVIKLMRLLKPQTQFIFATHNANFPVLGDAEQVIACAFSDGKVAAISGSIDCKPIQQAIISVMEGGQEAFDQRRRRYAIWKPKNSSL